MEGNGHFTAAIRTSSLQRSFGTTANGYLVMFPPAKRYDDVVVNFGLVDAPFVLRKEVSGRWSLVGDAYVNGSIRGVSFWHWLAGRSRGDRVYFDIQ